jgi:hypothetical protein
LKTNVCTNGRKPTLQFNGVHTISHIHNASFPFPAFTSKPLDLIKMRLPNSEPTKISTKKSGIIKGYAANTNQGLVR